jgi:hypothetical protein
VAQGQEDGVSEQLAIVPTSAIKELVDILEDLGIDPLTLHIDGARPLDARPDVRLWCRYRTDFETVCERLRLKPHERLARQHGQREWFAEHDDDRRRLLVQCVSFAHHDDWQPREAS